MSFKLEKVQLFCMNESALTLWHLIIYINCWLNNSDLAKNNIWAGMLNFHVWHLQVPLEGFSALQGISGSQKFQIHKAYGSADHLPSAHTW